MKSDNVISLQVPLDSIPKIKLHFGMVTIHLKMKSETSEITIKNFICVQMVGSEEGCLKINLENYLVWGNSIKIHHLQYWGTFMEGTGLGELIASAKLLWGWHETPWLRMCKTIFLKIVKKNKHELFLKYYGLPDISGKHTYLLRIKVLYILE